MIVKTYGVPDLTEWHGKLKAGSLEVKVSFTGGTASPSGAQPAYMVTKDPITQFVIEHSKEFKSGFIILVMSQNIPGTHPRMAIPKPQPKPQPQPQPEAPKPTGDVVTPTPQEPAPVPTVEDGDETRGPEGSATTGEHDGAGTDVADGTEEDTDGASVSVRVPDKLEAIEYLKEHFPEKGYTATKLRTQTAFQAACAECGVTFVFTA